MMRLFNYVWLPQLGRLKNIFIIDAPVQQN